MHKNYIKYFLKHNRTERLDIDSTMADNASVDYYSTLNTGPQQES